MARHAQHGMNNKAAGVNLRAFAAVVGQAFLPAAGIPAGLGALYSPPLLIPCCTPPPMNNSLETVGKNRGCR